MAKASIEVTSTLYHNGQTTIPSEIRKRLRLKRGDQIVYRMARDGRVILTPRKERLHQASLRHAWAGNTESDRRPDERLDR
jgi:AbrB family looped-hinge helix DNA binding protein